VHACPSCTACLLPAAIFAKRTQGTYAPQDCTTRGTGNAGIAPAVAGRCAIHQAAKRALKAPAWATLSRVILINLALEKHGAYYYQGSI